MSDREELVKGIQECDLNGGLIGNCPYKEILLLLKEHEPKTGHWIVLEDCVNEGIYCSECTNKIFDHATKPKKKLSQFCPNCGSRNEQFFRDGMVVFR